MRIYIIVTTLCLSLLAPVAIFSASIWGNKDLYSAKISHFKPGDIVTVVISEESSATSSAGTKTQKQNTSEVRLKTTQGASNFFKGIVPNANLESKSDLQGQGNTTRSGRLSAVITTRIDRILPNGYLYVKGQRKVRINKETQLITISGVIRPEDVTANNNISSTLLSDAEIKYEGKGPIGALNKPGVINKVLNWLF